MIDAAGIELIYMEAIFRSRMRIAGREDVVMKSRIAPGQTRLRSVEKIRIGRPVHDARALDPM